MNLNRIFIDSAPVSADLDFGINQNVVLRKIDISPRTYDGTIVKRNTFLTFTQVDPETRKGIKEHEYSFFNLNHESDYVVDNYKSKIDKLASIAECLGIDEVDFEEKLDSELDAEGIPMDVNLGDACKTPKGAEQVDRAITNAFYSLVKNKVGLDGPLLRLKTTSDKRGYLELPNFNSFIELMTQVPTELGITGREIQIKRDSQTTKTASADPLKASVNRSSVANVASLL
jgi:hypothetical protein